MDPQPCRLSDPQESRSQTESWLGAGAMAYRLVP